MADGRVSSEFYRGEADRLVGLASAMHGRHTRLKLLEVAAQFRRMAADLDGAAVKRAARVRPDKLRQAG